MEIYNYILNLLSTRDLMDLIYLPQIARHRFCRFMVFQLVSIGICEINKKSADAKYCTPNFFYIMFNKNMGGFNKTPI